MTWLADDFMTAEEVAKKLRLPSVRAVSRLRLNGDLVGTRIGRAYRYHPEDVEEFVALQRRRGRNQARTRAGL